MNYHQATMKDYKTRITDCIPGASSDLQNSQPSLRHSAVCGG